MTTASTSVAMWRRVLLVGITALVALLALSASSPTEAQAIRNPNQVLPNHVGWVKVTTSVESLCPPDGQLIPCIAGVRLWSWDGAAWKGTAVRPGIDVYAYPYAGEWHWIWTERTGWLAIETAKLDTGYSCTGLYCPMF